MKTKKDSFRTMIMIGFIMLGILLCILADNIGGAWLVIGLVLVAIILRIIIAINKHDPSKYSWHCGNCGKIVPAKEVDSNGIHIECGYDCQYGIYTK